MRLPPLTPRLCLALLALVCFSLLGFGVLLQQIEHIEPCPMCIMQRYAFVVVGLIALVAAVHNPALLGRRVYGVLLLVAAGAGLTVAVRQTWLQLHPPKFVECGPDLSYMLNSFPIAQALPKIFQGEGDCSKVDWTFLGLSIANWSGVCFTLAIIVVVLLMRRWASDRRMH